MIRFIVTHSFLEPTDASRATLRRWLKTVSDDAGSMLTMIVLFIYPGTWALRGCVTGCVTFVGRSRYGIARLARSAYGEREHLQATPVTMFRILIRR